jgi:hypothetical protein
MNQPVTKTDLRNFAMTVASLFVVFSGIPLVRHHPAPAWPLAAGGVLFVWGLLAPATLGPVHRLWAIVGRALGYVNTRILLSCVFFALITPIGLIMRLFGRDPLSRSRSQALTTYRVASPARDAVHMKEPF